MNEEVEFILDHTKEQMLKAISHLESDLLKIRAGKATPQMLDGIFVDYYGTSTPLNNVSNINTPDARTLMVQPWEKSMLGPIDKAIQAANLGLNPQNDGTIIRINVPPLTEERRKALAKQSKTEVEKMMIISDNEKIEDLGDKGLRIIQARDS